MMKVKFDDPTTDFSDETTVDVRHLSTHERSSIASRELAAVVEGVVGADLSAEWISTLRSYAGGNGRIKWLQVEDAVLSGHDSNLVQVRRGLSNQSVVVTDQMHVIRDMELHALKSGERLVPLALYLFDEGSRGRRPEVRRAMQIMGDQVRELVLDTTLNESGVGTLSSHLSEADAITMDGNVKWRPPARSFYVSQIASSIRKSLKKAAKLASKATTLIAPLLDPESACHDRVSELTSSRFRSDRRQASVEALHVVATRKLVVDEGHSDIIQIAASMREMAEIHWDNPHFSDREAAFEALAASRAEHLLNKGYVISLNDGSDLRLQIADVVAGWARKIIELKGYLTLAKTFRCVIYNSRILDEDTACKLDKEIAEYRSYMRTFAQIG